MYLALDLSVRTESLCKFALKPAAGKASVSRDGSWSSLHPPRQANCHGVERGYIIQWLLCLPSMAAQAFANSRKLK